MSIPTEPGERPSAAPAERVAGMSHSACGRDLLCDAELVEYRLCSGMQGLTRPVTWKLSSLKQDYA